jgi:hypothetical protein
MTLNFKRIIPVRKQNCPLNTTPLPPIKKKQKNKKKTQLLIDPLVIKVTNIS